jgi:uncharacterized protein (DUF983 family)
VTTKPSGAPVSALRVALRSRCPRCGEGKLYDGFLAVAEKCRVCGLNLGAHDTGDGPVAFIVLIVGGIVVGLALWLEVTYAPPMWVHAILWPPLIIALSLYLLRFTKSLLIALQFKHRAEDYNEHG